MKFLKYVIYPYTLISSVFIYVYLLNSSFMQIESINIKALLAIFFGLINIVFFEIVIPFKKEWVGIKKRFF